MERFFLCLSFKVLHSVKLLLKDQSNYPFPASANNLRPIGSHRIANKYYRFMIRRLFFGNIEQIAILDEIVTTV
jgi:hypothetical protein